MLPGTHSKVVDERDRLANENKQVLERARLVEASNESLSGERVNLISEIEELAAAKEILEEERAALAGKVEDLSARKEQLEADVAARDAMVQTEQQEVQKLRGTYDGLVEDLQSEVAAGRIEIQRLRDGIGVKLSQEILFATGSAQVSLEGRNVLVRVAERLQGEGNWVQVQGHTDDRKIHGRLARRYPSNWDLAGARATAVVRILEGAGVSPDRLSGVSFGPNRPVGENSTSEGRARNRRIEIRLVPVDGNNEATAEPAA